ncbi:MAG: hypothetical protein II160_03475, partial [Selenomonas sp.]|nr:hypothetical protein [Selenomonas sp.]
MWEKVCAGMLGAMMITGTAAGVSAAEKGSAQPQMAAAPAAAKAQASQPAAPAPVVESKPADVAAEKKEEQK